MNIGRSRQWRPSDEHGITSSIKNAYFMSLTIVNEFNQLLMLWTTTLLWTHRGLDTVMVLLVVVVVLPGRRCIEHGLR